jgi:serine protease
MRTAFAGAVVAVAALVCAPIASAAPNDPLYAQQYGPKQIRAAQAWTTSTGAGTTIAVVDSGVDRDHPDLAGKIVGGITFSGCADKPAGCGDGDWADGDPHGTHVAGIAAAATNNGTGIAGTAPDAGILAVKVLDAEGSGTTPEIVAGIDWAANNGADVINLSLGSLPGTQLLQAKLHQAVERAVAKGVVVVAAAGNEFVPPFCDSPSFANGAICVTATDPNELRASYSNFGIKPDLHVVAAPGGRGAVFCADDILSTFPPGAETACSPSGGYDFLAGTSMAAPHVAGVAALLVAQGRDAPNVIRALERTARQPGAGVRGVYNPVYGYGIVDAAAAVQAPR